MAVEVVEVPVEEARALQNAGARLIDVRAPGEQALGMPDGALAIERAELEANPSAYLRADESALLICGSGRRSMLAAKVLAGQGFNSILSVAGGFDAWRSLGLPVAPSVEDADFMERYSRHLLLPQVGLAGQQRLQAARVLLVGAGGLGSPVALYLAAAGIGFIRLVDDDVVDRSNLQRQVLHAEDRIGQPKVDSASYRLLGLNPRLQLDARQTRLQPENVESLINDVDVVVDGADNFPTRYLISDACVRLGKPMVYGAVHRFEGQASVFDAGRQRGVAPCYRCLFPEAPDAVDAPNCAQAGVLGVLPGIIGMLQATEVLKLVLDIGVSLSGRLLHVDALGMQFRQTMLGPDPDCRVCAPGREFAGYGSVSVACRTD